MGALYEDAQVVGDSDDKVYYFNFTTSTFIKREKPLTERAVSRMTGKPIENPSFKERFQNEAAALQLLRSKNEDSSTWLKIMERGQRRILFLRRILFWESNSKGPGMSAGCRTSIPSKEKRSATRRMAQT